MERAYRGICPPYNDSNSIIFRGIVTGVKARAMKKMNRVKSKS